jgi:hypothetical protein
MSCSLKKFLVIILAHYLSCVDTVASCLDNVCKWNVLIFFSTKVSEIHATCENKINSQDSCKVDEPINKTVCASYLR